MAITKAELASELKIGGMERVTGSNISLLPTRTGQGGDVFKRGGMEFTIASLSEVKQELRGHAQKAYARAQGLLGLIRAAAFSFGDIRDHWVQIDLQPGRVDYYLTLTDTKSGQKGAMSIEFGRDEYELEREDGSKAKIGGMTGKFLLHRAFGVAPNSLHGTGGGEIP